MAITQNGNSFTWTGTVTVTNATDLTTGVATLVLTPSGGVGQLPVLAQGTPGLPPVLDSVSVTTLPAGSSASGSWTTNSSGGSGQSSHYTLNLSIPSGPAGQSLNSVQIVTLAGSPAGGSFTMSWGSTATSAITISGLSATTIASALNSAFSSLATFTVTGTNPYYVTVAPVGSTAIVMMTANGALLSGGTSPTVSVQGSYTLAGVSDLDTTTVTLQDQYMVKWNSATSKFRWAAQPVGGTLQGTVTSYTGNNALQSLGYITIPAQPFNWVPDVRGQAVPYGTVNTEIDLKAVICSTSNGTTLATGQQVGYGYGVRGVTSAMNTAGTAPPVVLQQAFGGTLSSGYGVVPAGISSTLYFAANQTASTTDAYTVSATGAYFSVKINPVPGTN